MAALIAEVGRARCFDAGEAGAAGTPYVYGANSRVGQGLGIARRHAGAGLFDDNRVHGVPSAGVRFGELGMFRGSYSFNLFDQYRLDLFLDQAFGRDPRRAAEWQALTGVGIGGNIRGPFNTLLRGDVGKSFLPSRYRRPGSLVVQLQILKPL